MSIVGVSPTDILKSLDLLVKCCFAFGENGSKAQYHASANNNKNLINALKESRQGVACIFGNQISDNVVKCCDAAIAQLETQLEILEKDYDKAFSRACR